MVRQCCPVEVPLLWWSRQCLWSSRSCSSSTVVDISIQLCRRGRCGAAGAAAVMDVAVFTQRRSLQQERCLRFRSSPEFVGVSLCSEIDGYATFSSCVMVVLKGFFDAFCVIFRAPPVVPEVERQFSEPSSTHTCDLHNFMLRVCEHTHSSEGSCQKQQQRWGGWPASGVVESHHPATPTLGRGFAPPASLCFTSHKQCPGSGVTRTLGVRLPGVLSRVSYK